MRKLIVIFLFLSGYGIVHGHDYLQQATVCFEKGDERACDRYKAVLVKNPKNPHAQKQYDACEVIHGYTGLRFGVNF